MVRILHTFSVLALISTLALFVFCGFKWLDYEPQFEIRSGLSIIEKFEQDSNHSQKSNEPTLSPLIKQAQTFALYLNPPKPPKPKEAPAPKPESEPIVTAVKLPKIEPKFSLLSTSYYRSSPEKSLALVSEPGKGTHWVRAGENLGHFIVEEVRKGVILYRQGDQLHQMAINTKTSIIQTTDTSKTELASNKNDKTTPMRTTPHKPSTKTPKPLYKLGPRRSEVKTVALDHEKIGSG